MSAEQTNESSTLDAGAVSLPGVLMQAVTHIAPVVGLVFTVQAISGVAGIASPLALAIACLAMGTVSVSVIQLSKKISSAGGYFTWVSTALGPRSGFVVAWVFLLFEPIGAGINLAFLGGVLESTFRAQYGFDFPWWVTVLIGAALLTTVSYFGLKISVRFIMLMGAFEILVCVALAVTGLLHPGPGGINLLPFDPTQATSFSGMFLGIVFAVFAFSGFESVAPLAEESTEPRKTLPRAVVLSLVITGLFFVFTSWGVIVGWGTDRLGTFLSDGSPVLTLAHDRWGGAWVLLLIALINSAIGVGIAVQNASTRVIFGLSRSGVLPSGLAKIHPVRRVPVNAVWVQSTITLVVAIGGGIAFGPVELLSFAAIIITMLVIVAYLAGNLSMWRLYRREYPGEYNRFTHLVVPIFSSIILLYVGYSTLVPLPTGPNRWAPVVAAVWLVAGIVVVLVLSRKGSRAWLVNAVGAAADAEPEPVE